MKCLIALILLISTTQALDLAMLKSNRLSIPAVHPRYTEKAFDEIKSKQIVPPEVHRVNNDEIETQPGLAHKEPRIYGGHVARHGQFPWQALINFVCGGALISREWVLTSVMECTSGIFSFVVVLGAQYREDDKGETGRVTLTTKDVYLHEYFYPDYFQNDIALLKLPRQVELSEYIDIIRLPPYSMASDDLFGKIITISGWGETEENIGFSSELKYVTMPVMRNVACADKFDDKYVTAAKICVDTAGGRGFCNGDHGTPMILQMNDGRFTLIGIASFVSYGGCDDGKPNIYSRVTTYLDWIETKTGITIEN